MLPPQLDFHFFRVKPEELEGPLAEASRRRRRRSHSLPGDPRLSDFRTEGFVFRTLFNGPPEIGNGPRPEAAFLRRSRLLLRHREKREPVAASPDPQRRTSFRLVS